MQVGLNWWAFNHYGKYFGHQWGSVPVPHWAATLPGNLRLFKQMGISVVRWFVLCQGENYGPRPTKIPDPNLAGVPDFLLAALPEAAKTVYRFTPPPAMDPDIVAHFKQFLQLFKDPAVAGLKVIPSFIDFHFCARPDLDGGGGGRADVIVDPTKRQHFLDTALQPLLAASAGFEEQILAWEVMNEPVHVTSAYSPHVGRTIPIPEYPPGSFKVDVPEPVMKTFLTDAVNRINAAGFKSTVGHRFLGDLARFPTGNMPQYHYYGLASPWGSGALSSAIPFIDPNPIPDFNVPLPTLFAGIPGVVNRAFIGEIGSRLSGEYTPDHGNPWPELGGRDATKEAILFERLSLLKSKNYELALIWPETQLGGDDSVLSKLTLPKIKGLIRFTGGSFPGA